MERVDGCTLAEALRALTGSDPSKLAGADLARAVERAARSADSAPDSVPAGESRPAPAPTGEIYAGSWEQVGLRIAALTARALEHAHGRGVVHRDVKPSNLMLTRDGRVLLTDFGLSSGGEVGALSRSGSQAGSLPYMSPEQLRGGRVDERTDVYSLGVTLYELLALAPPFDGPGVEPLRAAVLAGAPLPLRRRNSALSWEAATVCRCALDPDPARRYADAGAFARDLEAALELRPIAARPPGVLRLARRWAQRRPAWAVGLSLGALLVVAGPLTYAVQQGRVAAVERRRADGERRSADEQARLAAELTGANARIGDALALATAERARAEENLDSALEAVELMLERVGARDLDDVPHMEGVRRELLERAVAFQTALLDQRAGDPSMLLRRARLLSAVASAQHQLGHDAEAGAAWDSALPSLRALAQADPASRDARLLLARALSDRAVFDRERGRAEDALAAAREASALLAGSDETGAGTSAPDGDELAARADAAALEGLLLQGAGRDAEALPAFESAVAAAEELVARFPGDERGLRLLAGALSWLALFRVAEGEVEGPTALFERALALADEALARDPAERRARDLRANSAFNLVSLLARAGRAEESRARGEEAVRDYERLVSDYPQHVKYATDLATALQALGSLLTTSGDVAGGAPYLDRALDLRRALLAAHPGRPRLLAEYGSLLANHAVSMQAVGDDEAARAGYDEAVLSLRGALAELGPDPRAQGSLRFALVARARFALRAARWREALADADEIDGLGPRTGKEHYDLGVLLAASAGQAAEDEDVQRGRDDSLVDALRERALASLRRAQAQGYRPGLLPSADPNLGFLHGDPELERLEVDWR
jgi:hypothetical protein